MSRRLRIPDLGGAVAVILHRPHPTVAALARQLEAIGLRTQCHWPELPPAAQSADYLFIDVDPAHEDQFPWLPGRAPMPTIALIGSEAPGRIEWLNRLIDLESILYPCCSKGECGYEHYV